MSKSTSKKILAIATSSNPMINGKRTGLWLSELTHFLEVIHKAGYEYEIASPSGGKIPLDEHSVTPAQLKDPANVYVADHVAFKDGMENSKHCRDIDPSQYVSIYLAGGHGTMWDFRQSSDLQRLITHIHTAGQPVTGVCHGVSGFVDARDASGASLVRGKRVTGFTNLEDTIGGSKHAMPFLLEDALKANGALFHKNILPFTSRVEVDGQLITGQNPQSARAVGERLVAYLAK